MELEDGYLTEFSEALRLTQAARMDFPGQLWDVTIAEQGRSKTGHFWSAENLAEIAAKFEGVPVYKYEFDGRLYQHLPDKVKALHPKGVFGNLAGHVRNLKVGTSLRGKPAVVGQIVVANSRTGEDLLAARKAGNLPGLSVDAMMKWSRVPVDTPDGPALQVHSIERPDSVDIVTNPAAGGAFDRLIQEYVPEAARGRREESMPDIKSLADLRAAHPQLVDEAIAQAVAAKTAADAETGRLKQEVATATAARDAAVAEASAAKTTIDALQAKQAVLDRNEMIGRLIQSSPLKDHQANKQIVSETFMDSLRKAADEVGVKALIDDRAALVGSAGRVVQADGTPSSVDRSTGGLPKNVLDGYFGSSKTAESGNITINIPREALTGR